MKYMSSLLIRPFTCPIQISRGIWEIQSFFLGVDIRKRAHCRRSDKLQFSGFGFYSRDTARLDRPGSGSGTPFLILSPDPPYDPRWQPTFASTLGQSGKWGEWTKIMGGCSWRCRWWQYSIPLCLSTSLPCCRFWVTYKRHVISTGLVFTGIWTTLHHLTSLWQPRTTSTQSTSCLQPRRVLGGGRWIVGCVWAAGTEQKTMHMTSYRYTVYLKCQKILFTLYSGGQNC